VPARKVIGRGRRALGAVGPRRYKRRRALTVRQLTERKIEQIAKSDRPIVAGPWIGGVGMELLYWIPFLNWLTSEGGVDPARVVAVSRGGADPWYADVAGGYVDLFDHYSAADIRAWHEDRLRYPDTESHITVGGNDSAAFALARERTRGGKAEWLHPSLMHRLFAPRWEWAASAAVIGAHTDYRPLPTREDAVPGLPDPYVAVKAYFSPSFPDTSENREALERVVGALARQTPVVLMRGGEDAGDHEPYVPPASLPVQDISDRLPPRRNLELQTRVVRDARAFVSPYGGFSFMGPYVGTPTLALYSHPELSTVHLDAIERVARRLGEGKRLYRARHVGTLRSEE
jgi:hypothetical protein